MIIINSINAPAPSTFDVTLNTQQKTAERNGNGKLIREVLPDKWTLQFTWEFGTPEDFYEWFNVLKGLTKIYFNITFPAPTGSDVTAQFYMSPVSASMLSFLGGNAGRWKNMKCSFVEV